MSQARSKNSSILSTPMPRPSPDASDDTAPAPLTKKILELHESQMSNGNGMILAADNEEVRPGAYAVQVRAEHNKRSVAATTNDFQISESNLIHDDDDAAAVWTRPGAYYEVKTTIKDDADNKVKRSVDQVSKHFQEEDAKEEKLKKASEFASKPGAYYEAAREQPAKKSGHGRQVSREVLPLSFSESSNPSEPSEFASSGAPPFQDEARRYNNPIGTTLHVRARDPPTTIETQAANNVDYLGSSSPSINRHDDVERSSRIIVAAELASDTEERLEETIRNRLLKDVPRASIVVVQHEKYEAPASEQNTAQINEQSKHRSVKEKLFGDAGRAISDLDIAAAPNRYIRKRQCLPWKVKKNTTSQLWVACIQTSQKAVETKDPLELERNVQLFLVPSQEEAKEIGLAMAPPFMLPYDENPICFLCRATFAAFRRPRHCRNCGVCVCASCSATQNWPSKMLPETYNSRNESTPSVCLACDWLARQFRQALLEGQYKTARNLYKFQNVNLRTPYRLSTEKRTEDLFPIHMAVMGGNLDLVKWLASKRHCPLRVPSKKGGDGPIRTSRGMSPLMIATQHKNVAILRYLVADKGLSLLEEENNLDSTSVLTHLLFLLKTVPESMVQVPNDTSERESRPPPVKSICLPLASCHTVVNSSDGDNSISGSTNHRSSF